MDIFDVLYDDTPNPEYERPVEAFPEPVPADLWADPLSTPAVPTCSNEKYIDFFNNISNTNQIPTSVTTPGEAPEIVPSSLVQPLLKLQPNLEHFGAFNIDLVQQNLQRDSGAEPGDHVCPLKGCLKRYRSVSDQSSRLVPLKFTHISP